MGGFLSHTPQKRRYMSTRIHAITTRMITIIILKNVETFNVKGGRYIQDSLYQFFFAYMHICLSSDDFGNNLKFMKLSASAFQHLNSPSSIILTFRPSELYRWQKCYRHQMQAHGSLHKETYANIQLSGGKCLCKTGKIQGWNSVYTHKFGEKINRQFTVTMNTIFGAGLD